MMKVRLENYAAAQNILPEIGHRLAGVALIEGVYETDVWRKQIKPSTPCSLQRHKSHQI